MVDGSNAIPRPLCVDLDGTVLRTDLLYESLLLALRRYPTTLIMLPIWLASGRPTLKRELARRSTLEPHTLPYREEVIAYIREQAATGRPVILATASDQSLATLVAEYLGIFTEVIGSSGDLNLKGRHKGELLVARFGERGFDYLGDSKADIAVWNRAEDILAVDDGSGHFRRVSRPREPVKLFTEPRRSLRSIAKALRVHQWAKNFLVFVPLIMAHMVTDVAKLQQTVLAFFSMSFCASAVYVLNDLLDLPSDRVHHSKKNRPFASGALPVTLGLAFFPFLLSIGVLLGCFVGTSFLWSLLAYLVLTTAYSFSLKSFAILDILVLASLYTLRIIAGGYSAGVPVSEWLRGFSMFFFLSLACAKRYSELFHLKRRRIESSKGRGYLVSDLDILGNIGVVSGFLSVLVFALYISNMSAPNLPGSMPDLYANPDLIWLCCPLLLYWVSRVWLLSHRGDLHEDPVVFALRDRASYLIMALGALVLWAAK